MKRWNVVLAVVAMIAVAGCQTFNDVSSEPNANVSELPSGGLKNVAVTSNETPMLSTNSGWTRGETGEGSVTVEVSIDKEGDEVIGLTNYVTIANNEGRLTFTLQGRKGQGFLVTEAGYVDASERVYELVRGTVIVDHFNEIGEEDEIINSGAYTFLFKAAEAKKEEAKAAALAPSSTPVTEEVPTEVPTEEVATTTEAGATGGVEAAKPALGEVTLQGVYYATSVKEKVKEADAAKAMSTILE